MEEKLMSEELMVKVDNVYKRYRLGLIGGGTLAGDLQSWWAKVRHKEDPNSKIGAKVYGKNEVFYALNGISFEVKKGEALGIIGGNGAGKSTTLKLLSQVTAPTEGKIYLNGRVASMLEVGTGFHPELTGRENIYLNGAILGMTKSEIDAKIEEIIDFSECRQFIDTPVKRYSSGMYVKLAFSVAAHLDSEIMIMDEVLAVGDMAFQKKCIDKMVGLSKEEGRTILYVSHNMNTIRQLCDRCIVLEHGKVVFEGDVEKSISAYIGVENKILKVKYDKNDLFWSSSLGKKASFYNLFLIGKKQAKYDNQEKMNIEVIFIMNDIEPNLQMGIQLYNEFGETLGFGYCKLNGLKVGMNKLKFEFDVAILPEGSYSFRLNLHELDAFGNYLGSYDQTQYVFFEVVNHLGYMVWNKSWWKSFRLKDFRIIEN